MITILAIVIILLALLGAPLFSILGLLAASFFNYLTDVPIQAMITQVRIIMEAPGLIALPLFTVMGYILNYGKTTERLAKATDSWLGWLPGGLAVTTIIAYTLFSAITGGSAIAIMALGGIYYTALLSSGYNEKFSLGTCTVFGGGGMLFPPSLPVIIIGFVAYESIDVLYVSALIPGLTVVGIFLIYIIGYSIFTKIPAKPFSLKQAFSALGSVALEIPLPFIIIGGIFSGWMTVGEVAIVSLTYVIITQCIIRREVSMKDLANASINAMVLVGAIFAILASALTLSNFLIDYEIPQKIIIVLQELISSRIVFLLVLNVFLLITGCLMDVFSAILVMVPLLLPVAKGYGIDPIHFAVIFLWNLEIGYSTPPIGFNLFIGSFRFGKSLESLWRAAIPGLIAQIAGLMVITYWSELTLWLPRVLKMKMELIPF